MQKKEIRIVNNVGYREHTNALFLKSRTLKFRDLVEHKWSKKQQKFGIKQNIIYFLAIYKKCLEMEFKSTNCSYNYEKHVHICLWGEAVE